MFDNYSQIEPLGQLFEGPPIQTIPPSSCSVELSTLKPEVTHRLTFDLTSGEEQGSITVLLTITGTEVTESLSVDMKTIAKNYVSILYTPV